MTDVQDVAVRLEILCVRVRSRRLGCCGVFCGLVGLAFRAHASTMAAFRQSSFLVLLHPWAEPTRMINSMIYGRPFRLAYGIRLERR